MVYEVLREVNKEVSCSGYQPLCATSIAVSHFASAVARSGGAIPSAICDLTNLEELNLQGEIPYDFDDGFDVDDEDSPAAAALHAFALPERFACLKRLRILRLDGHAGMTHLPIQVRDYCFPASFKLNYSSHL